MHAQGVTPVIKPRILSTYESTEVSASAQGWDDPAESLFEPTARWQMPPSRTEVSQSEVRAKAATSGSHAPPVLIAPVLPVQPVANLADRLKPSPKHLGEFDASITEAKSSSALGRPQEQSSPRPETVPAPAPTPRSSDQTLLAADLAKQARILPPRPGPIPSASVTQILPNPVMDSAQPSQASFTATNQEVSLATVKPSATAKATPPVLAMPSALPPPPRREVAPHSLPAPPPSITITIGRIEIRATTPSLPVPRTARVAGAVPQSLGDYLKSRAGRP
jgi:hypothetical protein